MTILEVVALEMMTGAEKNDREGGFYSLHEGFAVLLEEVDELRAQCWKKDRDRDPREIYHEAIQIAAIALRIAEQYGEP